MIQTNIQIKHKGNQGCQVILAHGTMYRNTRYIQLAQKDKRNGGNIQKRTIILQTKIGGIASRIIQG